MTIRTISVEVDLGDFDDDDIEQEAEERGLLNCENDDEIFEMFYAFKLGKTDRAIELAKKIAQDHTGKIL